MPLPCLLVLLLYCVPYNALQTCHLFSSLNNRNGCLHRSCQNHLEINKLQHKGNNLSTLWINLTWFQGIADILMALNMFFSPYKLCKEDDANLNRVISPKWSNLELLTLSMSHWSHRQTSLFYLFGVFFCCCSARDLLRL